MGIFQFPITRTPVHATLLWGDQDESLRVLHDSGAHESFIDATLVSELGITTQGAGWALYWPSHPQYDSYPPTGIRES